jgi:hypothetical protein
MIASRLMHCIPVVGLLACTPDTNRLQGARPMETGATTSATSSSTAGSGGSGGGAADGGGGGAGSSVDASTPDADLPRIDAGVVIHDDASDPAPCANNRAALGSIRLRAGGATPAPFAAAYNAELDALLGPGPLLIVLRGVNDTRSTAWIAAFGALAPGDPSTGVTFASAHVEVPFTLGADRSVQVAPSSSSFELRFAPPASDVMIPVGSIELAGVLSRECGSLVMTKAKLLVPAIAGSLAFHGSTIGALMGAPTEALGGQASAAWALEILGTAKQVYAPGILEDGGAERP